MKGKLLLVISVIMIFAGGIIANLVQNDFCKVKVRDIRFAGTGGMIMSGLLYIIYDCCDTIVTPVHSCQPCIDLFL